MCPSEPENCSVVLSTAPDMEVAGRLARLLVDNSLAACVNIIPAIRSVYRWEGKVHDDGEVLLVAKTAAGRVEELTRRLVENHPYSVPEVLHLTITGGSEGYLMWILKECAK